jgi:hypothetical protein
MNIGPDTTIGALLEAYPEAESVLIELAPAFAKLRNPVVRRTVAKVATLEQAAKIGGVSLHAMIGRLRVLAGQAPVDGVGDMCLEEEAPVPDWVAHGHVVEEVDAGEMLERGVHPIGRVREVLGRLGVGEVLVLRVPFRPEPLIDTMRRGGAQVYCAREGEGYLVYFGRLRGDRGGEFDAEARRR